MKRERTREPEPMPMHMTEKELSAQIVREAKNCGWLCYHTWLSKYSPAGFPDLAMVRNGQLLAWELKGANGKVSLAQREWLDALALVPGVDARVVRPADLEEAYKMLVSGIQKGDDHA